MRVDPQYTPVAAKGDKEGFILAMWNILLDAGIHGRMKRLKMLVLSSWAVGWTLSRCYNYNLFRMRTGSTWAGAYFVQKTTEENQAGETVLDTGAKWRAFNTFTDCVQHMDQVFIRFPRYIKSGAAAALDDENKTIAEFASALRAGGWWTNKVTGDERAEESEFSRRALVATNILKRAGIDLDADPADHHRPVFF